MGYGGSVGLEHGWPASFLRLPFGSSLAHNRFSFGALLWGTVVVFDWELGWPGLGSQIAFWFEFGAWLYFLWVSPMGYGCSV